MDARGFFLEQHGFVSTVSKGMVYAGLSDEQLRRHPRGRQGSLVWLLWHATRWEDVVVNTWVADRPQVLDRTDWLARLGAADRHCGAAAPHAGARALSRRLDLDALRAYREAVEEATRAAVGALGASDLDESVPASRLVRSAPDRTYANPGGRWMDEFWAERNRGWFLAFVNTHNAEHLIAEALTVRSLSGFPLGI